MDIILAHLIGEVEEEIRITISITKLKVRLRPSLK